MKERINFIKDFKVFNVAAKNDMLRPAFNKVFFRNGYAYASEGHMLVRAKIADISSFSDEQIALLEGKSIHASALRRVYEHSYVEIREDGFHAIDEKAEWEIVYLFTPENGANTPPDFEHILCKDKHADIDKIGMKANLLQKLTSAMGCSNNTRLDFTGSSGAIMVSEIGKPLDIKGLIMPMIID